MPFIPDVVASVQIIQHVSYFAIRICCKFPIKNKVSNGNLLYVHHQAEKIPRVGRITFVLDHFDHIWIEPFISKPFNWKPCKTHRKTILCSFRGADQTSKCLLPLEQMFIMLSIRQTLNPEKEIKRLLAPQQNKNKPKRGSFFKKKKSQ